MSNWTKFVDRMTEEQKAKHIESMICRPALVDDDGKFVKFIEPSQSEIEITREIHRSRSDD